jgi:hypothetical protein
VTKPKPSWPLIFAACLSFIPGLGIFFGSIAVTWALLSSRPRAILAAGIGAFGALAQLIGVLVWISFFQKSDPVYTRSIVQQTRENLVQVVVAVDDFRTREGSYPATLTQLQQSALSRRFMNIYDVAGGMFRLPRPFEYHVAADGDSFDVFSAGPDRKPGTDDDIRPELPDSIRQRSGYRPVSQGAR